jgi:hypothetical protein
MAVWKQGTRLSVVNKDHNGKRANLASDQTRLEVKQGWRSNKSWRSNQVRGQARLEDKPKDINNLQQNENKCHIWQELSNKKNFKSANIL